MPRQEERAWQRHGAARPTDKKRKETRRHGEPDRGRRREWLPDRSRDRQDQDDPGFPQRERTLPREIARARRRTSLAQALAELEEETEILEISPDVSPTGLQRGVVVELDNSSCRVELTGRQLACRIPSPYRAVDTDLDNLIAVGDEVLVMANGDERATLETVLPRHSVLAWPDLVSPQLQLVVANAKQLLIVLAWRNPAIRFELLDRHLIAAARSGMAPVICLNKVDLAPDLAACHAALQPYLNLNYPVIFTSARTGYGQEELRQVLKSRTTALVGPAGAGKSSLLQLVQSAFLAASKGETRPGNHRPNTTIRPRLWQSAEEGWVIDTPGLENFGLTGLRQRELVRFYPEITAAGKSCRNRDCSHTHEPGCGVKIAVQQGRIAATRYHSYKKIYYTLLV